MASPLPTPGSRPQAKRGFALLITITLLAFIVILLVGLAAYTRVETAVAGNTQRQAQARENALLGLNVALRQLQRYAGPDTRVTATAENFGGIDGTRHYTGAWSSDPAANASTTTTTDPTSGESTTATTLNAARPLTWLVSGNEFSVPDTSEGAAENATVDEPLKITPDAPGSNMVDLVGRNTVGTTNRADYVAAPLVDITAAGVPGTPATANTTIGRYAWWVGDQGVKAPVALADPSAAVTFAPYDLPDARSRIRQQIALGAGAADAGTGAPAFEPLDENNEKLVAGDKVIATSQLAFLRTPANAAVGLARVQQNFHAWSPNNFAVIANTKDGGLRQDLSLKPDLLGAPFAAWANYAGYMEKFRPDPVVETPTDAATGDASGADASGATDGTTAPTAETPVPTGPTISPAYSDDPLRRRYVMTPHFRDNSNGSHQVTPILTYFLLSFNVRTVDGSTATVPLEVRARWMISLWNPYTSALVPENLQVEITGLPTVNVVNDEPTRAGPVDTISLSSSSVYGAPLKINLPWDATSVASEERQSWLPGRVYTWRSAEDKTKTTDPAAGFASEFDSRTLDDGGEGVIRSLNTPAVDGDDPCHLESRSTGNNAGRLQITLYTVRADGTRAMMGRYTSPQFLAEFSTKPDPINQSGYQFSYVFRLAESIDNAVSPGAWLTTAGRDPRLSRLSGDYFVVGENGDDPAQYGDSYKKISNPGRLLDRATDSLTYTEDVPVFELPRGPLLSLGALQHFRITGSRPFMIGNPWGTEARLNGIALPALFDRFYFSGVTDGVAATANANGDLVFPNPLLKPLRKSDGTKVTLDEFRATALVAPPPETPPTDGTTADPNAEPVEETPPTDVVVLPPDQTDGRSSKYVLQAGAFNLNSVSAAAWAAVLRSVRFPAPQAFRYLDLSETSGTAADSAVATASSDDAQFFRFSQSAQETFKPGVHPPLEDGTTPPRTELYRQGMRSLNGAQVSALAAKIVDYIGKKHAAADPDGGPFRSVAEFLSPSLLFAGVGTDADGNPVTGAPRSLLEAAIADTGLNLDGSGALIEFSSQFLTQADIMTALAPILYPRSDTFVIRSYGEAVNPATNGVEGKAWCEAIMQRLPEYFDPSLAAESLPDAFEPVPNPDDPTAEPTSTQAQVLNKKFGRRFKIVSFRWLTRADI